MELSEGLRTTWDWYERHLRVMSTLSSRGRLGFDLRR